MVGDGIANQLRYGFDRRRYCFTIWKSRRRFERRGAGRKEDFSGVGSAAATT
jgi:hypothetical protein